MPATSPGPRRGAALAALALLPGAGLDGRGTAVLAHPLLGRRQRRVVVAGRDDVVIVVERELVGDAAGTDSRPGSGPGPGRRSRHGHGRRRHEAARLDALT